MNKLKNMEKNIGRILVLVLSVLVYIPALIINALAGSGKGWWRGESGETTPPVQGLVNGIHLLAISQSEGRKVRRNLHINFTQSFSHGEFSYLVHVLMLFFFLFACFFRISCELISLLSFFTLIT